MVLGTNGGPGAALPTRKHSCTDAGHWHSILMRAVEFPSWRSAAPPGRGTEHPALVALLGQGGTRGSLGCPQPWSLCDSDSVKKLENTTQEKCKLRAECIALIIRYINPLHNIYKILFSF